MADIPPIRARLGERLRELRARRFRFGTGLATELGWQQSKVSKIESGRQVPSADDLAAWLVACGGDAEELSGLTDLLARARVEDRSFVDLWRLGRIAADQRAIGELERRARMICDYTPSMVPALVQTAAYARAMLTTAGGPALLHEGDAWVGEMVAERMQRQQLLYMPGRRVRLLMGEAALYVRFGSLDESAAILAGQLDRLMTLFGLPNVEIGVLPFVLSSPVLPIAGFSLVDDAAWTETLTTEREVYDPAHVELYSRAFEIGMSAAARGDDAADLIRRASRAVQ